VRAAGVEFEAGVSFAALHLVLQPLLGELGHLTEWHRDALTTALAGRSGLPGRDRHRGHARRRTRSTGRCRSLAGSMR
jgi:hypothetical protein